MNTDIKILIVGNYSFGQSDATSITLRNLFGSYNHDQIAFLYTTVRDDFNPEQFDGYSYFVAKPCLFYNSGKKSLSTKLSSNRSQVVGIVNQNASIKKTILNRFHTVLAAYRSLIPFKFDQGTMDFIKGFNPDVVYTLGGSYNIDQLACRVADFQNVPIVPHFMDDWPHVTFTDNVLLIVPRLMLMMSLKRVFKRSNRGLAISKYMAEEYKKEYSIPFYSAMNTVGAYVESDAVIKKEEPFIVYAGGLHLNRADSIAYFANLLNQIQDFKALIFIYTSNANWEAYKHLFSPYPFVRFGGFKRQQDMVKVYVGCDYLLHVESFDKSMSKYTRLSISTKIPEYLSMGKPIIAIGPDNIASIKYLIENHCAFVISSLSESPDAIRHILDVVEKKMVGRNAKALFNSNHLLEKQQNVMNKAISESVLSYRNQ